MGKNLRRKKSNSKKPKVVAPSLTLAVLPYDILSHIYYFCPPKRLVALSSTCKILRSYAKEDIIRSKIEHGVLKEKIITGTNNGRSRLIPTQCPSCNKLFRTKNHLREHLRFNPKCILPYKCPRCNNSYFTKNSRLQHMRQANHQWTEKELEDKKKEHDKKLLEQAKVAKSNNNNSTAVVKAPHKEEKPIEISGEIDFKSIKVGEEIADGPGTVHSGFLNDKNIRIMNLKRIPMQSIITFKTKHARKLLNIQNTQVVPFLGTCSSPRNFHIVNGFSEGITLYECIRTIHLSKKRIKLESIRSIATDVAQGMRYLYSCNPPVSHGDLRTVNILVDSQHHAKVINYGLHPLYPGNIHNDSLPYTAPELFSVDAKINEKTDVYSFALVLHAMFALKEPYEELNVFQIIREKKKAPLAVPKSIPKGIDALIRKCCYEDPTWRPRFKKIVMVLADDATWK